MIKEPTIYIGEPINIDDAVQDILIFIPESTIDKDVIISRAKLKFIELCERKQFQENRQPSGEKPLTDRPRRKRMNEGERFKGNPS